tara:strand:+ start:96 stop:1691 length:1596 start_codon:yes stop_codon:yes gene_type:complete
MDIYQVIRLYHTIKHLKFIQVYYQVKYRLIKPKRSITTWTGEFQSLSLNLLPVKRTCYFRDKDVEGFDFLNVTHSFELGKVDWSFLQNGMLWTYNLNYFDWLHQESISKEQGLETLITFYTTIHQNPIGLHPYPTSLRIINASKFITTWGIDESWLYYKLVSDIDFLSSRLEYHLLANHLLENAFALYIGGLVTGQEEFFLKGKKLLTEQLQEQILDDGMHYERSPMYHLIILEKLLDALNFAKNSNDNLEPVLERYAIKMVGLARNWEELDRIPMMHDSAYNIALPLSEILDYSQSILGMKYPSSESEFKSSGYKKILQGRFQLIANVGAVRPSYQPGHAHADEFNFELFFIGLPIIVDTGISTYEKNSRRQLERSTDSHNCVSIGGNSSNVWSGFRVGQRARVTIISEDEYSVKAQHDGYRPIQVMREFNCNEGLIKIIDSLLFSPRHQEFYGRGRLHLHPNVVVIQLDEYTLLLNEKITITFSTDKYNSPSIELQEYQYAEGFNVLKKATVITYTILKKTSILVSEAS